MREMLTIREVVDLVGRLDNRKGLAVTARQLRYWDGTLALGAKRAADGQNAARMFTLEDVAVVRLVRRLQRDGVRDRAIWALLVIEGEELRGALHRGTSRVLWVESNGRTHLLSGREAASQPLRECYPLADVVDGLPEALRQLRAGEAEAWNGAAWVPVQALTASA